MADLHPSDPRQLLEDAANALSGYASVHPEKFPTEVRTSDLDAFLIDPREQEQDHSAEGAGQSIYNRVPIEYVVYNVTEGGEGNRKDARSTLDTLKESYVTQVTDTFANSGAKGQIEKTGRIRTEIKNGETTLMLDAISFRVSQHQDY